MHCYVPLTPDLSRKERGCRLKEPATTPDAWEHGGAIEEIEPKIASAGLRALRGAWRTGAEIMTLESLFPMLVSPHR